MKESAIQRKIIAAVKAKYPRVYIRKISDRFNRGVPDLICCFRASTAMPSTWAKTLFIEVKAEDGKQSEIQKQEQNCIVDSGASYIVARDVATVLAKLEYMGAK
jgi:hypothetical protein